ncbi:MAG: hypothetical protein AB1673_07905 [Actinomycetota bacterium]
MAGSDEAERALGLADEAASRLDVDAAVAHLSAAIRGFTEAAEPCRAALACARLGDILGNAMGNITASRAWYARARRLVEDVPPCLEQGWVSVAAMGCDVDDPAELLAAAELALDRARRFGDVNLETKALADAGLAHVQAGRVEHGMALLDESMALACGPADDTDATAKSVCSFFTACYFAADFARAATWADTFRRRGLLGLARGAPVFLSSHCDSVQASLLVELGRWGEAEAVLVRARQEFESAMGMASWHPDIALADLRVRQGRLAEAEALLVGRDQAVQALLPAARLHLARGDQALARAAAQRGLRAVGDDRLRGLELLTVLVDAAVAMGDVPAAARACEEMLAREGGVDVAPLRARAEAARSRAMAAAGDLEGAVDVLEATLDGIDPARLPWLRATLLVELARRRDEAGDRAGAVVDARAAAAALATLDVVMAPADADLLRRLSSGGPGQSPEGAGPGGRTATLARQGKGWVVADAGRQAYLAPSKGLAYLAELLRRPGTECHVLDLVDRAEGVPAPGGADRRALGDAGPVLDARARAAYRHRIEELRADVDDALAAGRLEVAEALQGELDQFVAQLAHAFGLGGRDRRASSAAERARLNVTRALRTAISRVGDHLPEAGEVLDRRARTGFYCAYEPVDGDEVRWAVDGGSFIRK